MAEDLAGRGGPPDVAVRDAIFRDGGAPGRAWGPLSLEARGGEFLAVLGPPGSGKSRLVKMLAGLAFPHSGGAWVGGRRVDSPRIDAGIVFEQPVLLTWRTALSNVLLQLEARGRSGPQAREEARRLMALLGLEGLEDGMPHQLNNSDAQRVSLCRALIHDPRLLLMDDPFRSLDPFGREQLWNDLQRLRLSPARTVVLATSHITEAIVMGDRVAVLSTAGGLVASEEIDLPRPRRLDRSTAARIVEYGSTLRRHLHSHGLLE